ncbi:MAG: tRNA 2-thiouridine(34) synthase MnmA [Chloroflexi bacterium]|nr:tRNA 2-thiouridine(34) synthase MnmA [Chloroflexota bacterium]MYC47552.1 tRNA 2-thiouridine(34) synthase MnmA [Chloroflexota bacterium]
MGGRGRRRRCAGGRSRDRRDRGGRNSGQQELLFTGLDQAKFALGHFYYVAVGLAVGELFLESPDLALGSGNFLTQLLDPHTGAHDFRLGVNLRIEHRQRPGKKDDRQHPHPDMGQLRHVWPVADELVRRVAAPARKPRSPTLQNPLSRPVPRCLASAENNRDCRPRGRPIPIRPQQQADPQMSNPLHPRRPRVAVAMSGGVDSSVAAALLAAEGFSVVGFTVDIWPEQDADPGERNCCSPEATATARAVCRQIGAAHAHIDMRDQFRDQVVSPFAASYARGLTPNPCIDCNHHIKFDAIFPALEELGADLVATGHYARTATDPATGRRQLLAAADPAKDQSYVLYVLSQERLARLLLPLGSLSKSQVRRQAQDLGLPNADRPDSVDICFVAGDYRDFLSDRGEDRGVPGPLLLTDGTVIGEHRGISAYTVGQRRGLGVSAATPLYVARIDPGENAVVLGRREELLRTEFEIAGFNPVSLDEVEPGQAVTVRVRSSARPLPCWLQPKGDGRVSVEMGEPVWGVAPGQAAVFYDGPFVLGGGTITPAAVPLPAERLAVPG